MKRTCEINILLLVKKGKEKLLEKKKAAATKEKGRSNNNNSEKGRREKRCRFRPFKFYFPFFRFFFFFSFKIIHRNDDRLRDTAASTAHSSMATKRRSVTLWASRAPRGRSSSSSPRYFFVGEAN
jgi:hypothetical protein